ncbi:hypothetical protein DMC01_02855 [Campylobacter troglodytis]|nr:hypothetical protein DMC01_02855 [Campylobacter troglodytis]
MLKELSILVGKCQILKKFTQKMQILNLFAIKTHSCKAILFEQKPFVYLSLKFKIQSFLLALNLALNCKTFCKVYLLTFKALTLKFKV